MVADLHIVGAGLIGTSIGLALRGSSDVVLSDTQPTALGRAVERGAGRQWDGREQAALVLLAVPPALIASTLSRMQRLDLGLTWSHVASVQSVVGNDIERLGCDLSSVCGGHPLAGRERSGPDAAVADLFWGRPWVLCPNPATSTNALAAVRELAERCGAEPVVMEPLEHDRAVAVVSHLPQVAASAVAARLLDAQATGVGLLAGPGLQDTTRIAASDPALWVDVLQGNAVHVAPLVREVSLDLAGLADALDSVADPAAAPHTQALSVLTDLLVRGRAGRRLVPVKRGAHDQDFVTVPVSVPDRPGQLAGVLATAAAAGVNVEDVHVEHLPGRPRGVIQLLVHAGSVDVVRVALAAAGWDLVTAG